MLCFLCHDADLNLFCFCWSNHSLNLKILFCFNKHFAVCFSSGSQLALPVMFGCSPTGQHLVSCKDVSLYLQSIGDLSVSQRLNSHRDDGNQDDREITENVSTYFWYFLSCSNFIHGVHGICNSMQV